MLLNIMLKSILLFFPGVLECMPKLMPSIIAILCLCSPVAFANWDEQLAKHEITKQNPTNTIILEQYQAYNSGKLPKIADATIKNIPIHESGEALVDISQQHNPRMTMMPTPSTPFASPDQNSGLPSAPFVRTTLYKKLNRLIVKLDQLAPQFGYKAGQISIKVFEGLRDIDTQNKLFNDKAKEIQAMNPGFTQEQVFTETSKWVSPTKNNVPAHSTGAAIDLRLYDEQTGTFLDMGKFGVIWGQNNAAPTFSSEITDEQIANRLFLLLAASSAGLVNYPYEFWHFSTGDRYAVYWQKPEQMQAIYNSIKATKG